VTTGNQSDESKFRMILLAAKRARQVQSGAKPLVHSPARKATRIAQEEFKAGVLPYEVVPLAAPKGGGKEHVHAAKAKK
jgi:DNA-directed RNA polymerase subunit omega